jgi:hypothetical protein
MNATERIWIDGANLGALVERKESEMVNRVVCDYVWHKVTCRAYFEDSIFATSCTCGLRAVMEANQ